MLYFVRHGEVEANVRGVFAGRRDNGDLTEKGMQQARAVAHEIKDRGLSFSTITCSPLDRTQTTARIIVEGIGHQGPVTLDERIEEYDIGVLRGTPKWKITAEELVATEGVEDPNAFRNRVWSFIRDAVTYRGDTLMVSHNGVYRMLETIRLGLPPAGFYGQPEAPNAAIIPLAWVFDRVAGTASS